MSIEGSILIAMTDSVFILMRIANDKVYKFFPFQIKVNILEVSL